jgi:serine/threonine protein kinase
MPAQPTKKDMSWTTKDLEDSSRFEKIFARSIHLGRGSDGIVTAYRHIITNDVVVVKTKTDHAQGESNILKEISALRNLGKHEHVTYMLTSNRNLSSGGPAIFFQMADLGDAVSYRQRYLKQEHDAQRPLRLLQATILKFVRDMSLGLDFIHNKHRTSLVHNDIKPENILVFSPLSHNGSDGVPTEPVFKIADFARLAPYPPPQHEYRGYRGTYEFAPPRSECSAPVKPSVDIWALGCTIQNFAFGWKPIQSRQAFVEERARQGKDHPQLENKWAWGEEQWRTCIPVMYRPLDRTWDELMKTWDPPHAVNDHQPYSETLNRWYTEMVEIDPELRVTAAELAKYAVPMVDRQLLIERESTVARIILDEAESIRAGKVESDALSSEQLPSDEGNYEGYGEPWLSTSR